MGEILLSDLIAHRELLRAPGVFVANIPRFFLNLDD